jgi:redox-sensing transcriptional repressor
MRPSDQNIPDPSLRRLSVYLHQLEVLLQRGVARIASPELAAYTKVGAATLRRDLALFGKFGHRGVGYDVLDLVHTLRIILGTQQLWPTVVVGAGSLGQALLHYPGLLGRGFSLVAAFDAAPAKIGKAINSVPVYAMEDLASLVATRGVRLAILAVPAEAAQTVVDELVGAGIEGILNFSSPGLIVPPGVHVDNVDITGQLEYLAFHVGKTRP